MFWLRFFFLNDNFEKLKQVIWTNSTIKIKTSFFLKGGDKVYFKEMFSSQFDKETHDNFARKRNWNIWTFLHFKSLSYYVKNSILLAYILKKFLRSGQNRHFCCNRIKILTHRKTKNPRSKKFRYIWFMERFNI